MARTESLSDADDAFSLLRRRFLPRPAFSEVEAIVVAVTVTDLMLAVSEQHLILVLETRTLEEEKFLNGYVQHTPHAFKPSIPILSDTQSCKSVIMFYSSIQIDEIML